MYNSTSKDVFARAQTITARESMVDASQGSGLADTTDNDVMAKVAAPHSNGNTIAWLLFLVAAFFLVRWVLESQGEKVSGIFSELKLSLWNMFVVTLFAIPGFVIAKTLSVKYLSINNPIRILVTAA